MARSKITRQQASARSKKGWNSRRRKAAGKNKVANYGKKLGKQAAIGAVQGGAFNVMQHKLGGRSVWIGYPILARTGVTALGDVARHAHSKGKKNVRRKRG